MKKRVALFPVLFLTWCINAQSISDLANAYISEYSSIAVDEMLRTGVPASITLAQGMLESGYGRGRLATQANNHFGIKCHSDWKGETIFHNDDRKGECFRKYPSAGASFRDHSDFLRYKDRYKNLFSFEITDYESWAHALKKAGYATDPDYATKLINLINTYDLGRFDRVQPSVSEVIPPSPIALEAPVRYTGNAAKGTYPVSLSREILQINGIPFVYAREGETFSSVAGIYDLFLREILRFNDADSDRQLSSGEIVFLRPKASRAVRGMDKHVCQGGETLEELSRRYAVKLSKLKKLNNINNVSAPLRQDDTILLR